MKFRYIGNGKEDKQTNISWGVEFKLNEITDVENAELFSKFRANSHFQEVRDSGNASGNKNKSTTKA